MLIAPTSVKKVLMKLMFVAYITVAKTTNAAYAKFPSPTFMLPDENTRPRAPIKPKTTPVIFIHRKPRLKKSRPITTVNNGTSEFSMPVNELLIWVCAKGNRYAGIPLPKSPAMQIFHHCVDLICLKFRTKMGERKTAEITILNEAT